MKAKIQDSSAHPLTFKALTLIAENETEQHMIKRWWQEARDRGVETDSCHPCVVDDKSLESFNNPCFRLNVKTEAE